jgi:bifunctional non-homologous end joining protein LigD
MSLAEYRRKRDFGRTPEPAPARPRKRDAKARHFVIQLHHARARHFDFRLELGGVLRSWAVPKGPSLRPADKRLAVEVEDHPLDYGNFEGDIPAGAYGAGHVRIVERGQWHPMGDPARALAAGKLDFRLEGEHLQGGWSLVRTGPAGLKAKWLLVKHDDPFAADTDLDTLVADTPPASGKKPTRSKPARAGARGRAAAAAAADTDWAERAQALPGAGLGRPAASPQLATLATEAPDGEGWLHEIKWDGYRLLAWREGDQVRLQSRNAVDWSGRFPEIEAALRALPVRSLLLDAELVALNESGYSEFARLQFALEGAQAHPVSAVAFDLLALDGVDITGCSQLSRKALLQDVLAARPSRWLAYGEHIVGHGPQVFARALAEGYEGIVSKRVDAPYAAGRSSDWLKVKRRDGFEAIVVGHTLPKGSRRGIGALLLAVKDAGGYRYVGRVGSGMGDQVLRQLREKLDAIATEKAPVELPAHTPLSASAVRWVRPRLVVEVEHRGWGKEGLLRQASFLRLRPDKSVTAMEPDAGAEFPISSPERVVYPRPKISKRQVADYYQAVAPWLLQEVAGRPLSLLRAPDGIEGERFFQKHHGDALGRGVKSLPVREKTGRTRPYLMIDDLPGLMALVQMNTLELHPWGVLPGQPDRPDRITFDLDPGDGVGWRAIVRAATDIRDHLAAAGLASHALLSGGKGVHVVVPLAGHDGWPAVKRFARSLAHVLAEHEPGRFVAVAKKSERPGRIFIDWLRNGRGATSIAPWSLRARPGAPVAMPVSWPRLEASRGADEFRLAEAVEHTAGLDRHPWGEYRARPQRLPGGGRAR